MRTFGRPNIEKRRARAWEAGGWLLAGVVLAQLAGCATTPRVSQSQAAAEAAVTVAGGSGGAAEEAPALRAEETVKTPGGGAADFRFEKDWGIQIVGTRLTAGGYMIDFRYRVTDPQKALPLFNRKDKPYLIDQASGAKMAVPNPPKVGPMRTSNKVLAGRNYFIFFANPGRYIKRGNKVTVVIGDFRAEDLTVE